MNLSNFKMLTNKSYLFPKIFVIFKNLNWNTKRTISTFNDKRLKEFLKPFIIRDSQLQEALKRFRNEVRKGLSKKENSQADTKCYVTFVQNLPKGDEVGKYLALDLGGTNFRVLLVTLNGLSNPTIEPKIYAVPKEIMLGTGKQLFDHIAECLSSFAEEHKVRSEHLPLGFTFSYPCIQLGLTKAILVRWTKGFNCSGVEKEDVGRLLQEAIARRGDNKINLEAILNDTIGTLMSCAHRNPDCRIGVIVGTGCNACYVERVEEAELLDPKYKVTNKNILINVEWGAFGDGGALDFIRTGYDKVIDAKSVNVGMQIFEKMVAGMYLGDIVRLILIDAIKNDLIFSLSQNKQQFIDKLTNETECFESSMISDIEDDTLPELKKTRHIIKEIFGDANPSEEDCQKLCYICECISMRSASLVAVNISGLINKINEPKVVVGIDGSVYRFHPKFDAYLRSTIKKLINPKIQFDIKLAEDGSGIGAALVAAVASKNN